MNLYNELRRSHTKCPLSHHKFLPLNILHDVITVDKVQENIGSVVNNNDLPSRVVQEAKRVFAILVLIGHEDAIGNLLSEGLTDNQLPLSRSDSNRNMLCGSVGNKAFETFQGWKEPIVDHFLEKQWRVQAPVFDTTGRHFNLHQGCALPLQPEFKQIGSTAFSKVFKCALYPAHYQQTSNVQIDQVEVAIKELHDEASFEREKKNLTTIQNLNNRHLIKHIATCQRDSSYYVIFPLADGGNLLEYWERENMIPRDPTLVRWALEQMLGLAGAIHALHHELGGDTYCRHGDLKPANILQFKEDGVDILVIADLGVSRIHEQPTVLRRSGTTTMATTRSYEAPEVESERDQPRARTYDTWSFGCVLLEFVIWLLYDFDAIKNFEENRRRPLENPHASFYRMTSTGAEISLEVLDAIKALRKDPRCKRGTALGSVVSLIADKLLVTTVQDRCNAEQLRYDLQNIVDDAQDPSYLLNMADQPSSIPKVFLRSGQPPKTW